MKYTCPLRKMSIETLEPTLPLMRAATWSMLLPLTCTLSMATRISAAPSIQGLILSAACTYHRLQAPRCHQLHRQGKLQNNSASHQQVQKRKRYSVQSHFLEPLICLAHPNTCGRLSQLRTRERACAVTRAAPCVGHCARRN